METIIAYFTDHQRELVSSLILISIVVTIRLLSSKSIRRFSYSSDVMEHRSKLVIRHINSLLLIISVIALIVIWGVQTRYIIATLSAVITVIGVAFFAQWSILSNVTSGIILLFSFPFRIGDIIRIHDKDFPIEAEVLDIRTFHILLRTQQDEIITYPNNLLLQKGVSIVRIYSEDGYGD